MSPARVLLTGASGYLARWLLPAIADRYDLRLVDVAAPAGELPGGIPGSAVQVADLTTTPWPDLLPLFEGVDTVIHFGYRKSAPRDCYDVAVPHIEKFEVEYANIKMANNVYRCAFEAGVRRVVVASSNHATDWYEHAQVHSGKRDVITPDLFPLSDNFYGWSKAAYEHLGFVYASGSLGRQLENVQLRFGATREIDASTYAHEEPPAPQPGPRYPTGTARFKRDLGAWISQRDLQQLTIRAVEAEDICDESGIPFAIAYGVSNNTRAFWSLQSGRDRLGYEPQDDSELQYADAIREFLVDAPKRHPGRLGVTE